jgi:isoleucyl-tRNA synthetase
MAFAPVDRTLDLPALEERVLARWRNDDVFATSLRKRADAPRWVFYEGPPTANGRPGLHHLLARSFKDLFPRFQTMRGKLVERKAGWDCHGLPVEVEVEKELGFSGKPMIEDFGIEAFNQRCRESVHRYVEDWSALTGRIGMWLDTSDAYWTLSNDYIESVWWLFHQLWDKSLLYEGVKVVPYCGRCGTALSSHELGQPGAYQDVTEASVYVRFPVIDRDFDLLVWTTTPWTLVSNVGAAIGRDVEYVRARGASGRRDVVLAASRVGAVLGDEAEIVGPVAVSDLVGLRYERPFDFVPPPADTGADPFRVVAADFVTLDDGSGIVHLAPAFGEIDREVGAAEGLGMLNPVGPAARFDDSVPPPYAGRFVKDADAELIDALASSERLERVVDYTHSYPHCWRCSTPLIYWAKPEWFARTSNHKADLLRENEKIGWHPEHIRKGRFGDWLENNVDWALSRDRFWGTPIPVWRCAACSHDACFGSVADLGAAAGRDLSELDLHRPFVDDIRIECPECGGASYRVEPVLDAWFDSGSMPTAQLHYPFEARDELATRFPADFICEAIDQTRGWFYSLLAVNTLVFGQAPYRNVVCLGLIVSADGQKMSKSKGNVIDPWSIIDARGADALRWYLFSAGSPWSTRRVSEEGIDEATRRFLLTLWNTYSFFVTYAELDGWEPGASSEPVHVMDRWARSRLTATVDEVTTALDDFDVLRAAQALEGFVDELSNWYVRRSRPRFWKAADPVAHTTLHRCLGTVAQLLAPFCPFIADEMWANLSGSPESVHLSDWPTTEGWARDESLEQQMSVARDIVSLGRAARVESRIETRQPLARALVLLPAGVLIDDAVVVEVADELNVKRLEPVTNLEGLLDYSVVPNFRALGARLRDRMPVVKGALASVDGAAVQHALDRDGVFVLELEGGAVELRPDDVEVRAQQHEELALARDGALAVALDLRLDDALRREGAARKLVRILNDHRKSTGLEIADRIRVELATAGAVLEAIVEHQDWIAGEVLAVGVGITELAGGEGVGGYDPFEIDGTPVGVRIEKA